MDFPMGSGDGDKKDDGKNAEGKRERDPEKKEKEPVLKKQNSVTLSVSLSSPNPSPTKVDTFSGILDEGATFAVWNLWDLGGGPHASHWKEENLAKLPGELKAIDASVLGLLEIKTGHAIAVQLPKDKPNTTAFEIGAMTGWLMKWYITNILHKNTSLPPKNFSAIIAELSKMMWVSDDPTFLNEGLKASIEFDPIVYIDDLESVLKDMILAAADYLNDLSPNDYFNRLKEKEGKKESKDKTITGTYQLIELYDWMVLKCSKFENSWYQKTTIQLDGLKVTEKEDVVELKRIGSEKKKQLLGTWKYVPKAFENFGVMVNTNEPEKKGKEAQGINLITPVLLKFVEENKNYKQIIIDAVEGDGETTAFLFDDSKFTLCCRGSIELKGTDWRARSPGFIHLKCKAGTLKQDELMVVAWHAPSENNVGERQHAYELLNKHLSFPKIINPCLENTNVVLLADMNIRFAPARCESKIIDAAYKGWLPESKTHMKLCTSLKMSGTGGAQWNHPFDKVILLNRNKLELKITDHEKMKDTRSAEEIRVFSDHSWVKAKISLNLK